MFRNLPSIQMRRRCGVTAASLLGCPPRGNSRPSSVNSSSRGPQGCKAGDHAWGANKALIPVGRYARGRLRKQTVGLASGPRETFNSRSADTPPRLGPCIRSLPYTAPDRMNVLWKRAFRSVCFSNSHRRVSPGRETIARVELRNEQKSLAGGRRV